ncbi:hypothetical protein E2933_25545 [Escherichia coli]|nr:hypothetical protein [Escherichia coli]EFC0397014.1 hypothetical protein [Escherichia coli]
MNMLLKKILCALLPDPVPDVPKNSTNSLIDARNEVALDLSYKSPYVSEIETPFNSPTQIKTPFI